MVRPLDTHDRDVVGVAAMRACPRLHFTDELVDKRAAGQPGKRTCQFEQSILAQSFVSAPGVALE